jgi:hypothetical protein
MDPRGVQVRKLITRPTPPSCGDFAYHYASNQSSLNGAHGSDSLKPRGIRIDLRVAIKNKNASSMVELSGRVARARMQLRDRR